MVLNFAIAAKCSPNKLMPFILILACLNNYAQSKSIFDERYYDHWEAIDSKKSLLEIIIYKNEQTTRVIELDFNSNCDNLGTATLFATVYVHKKQNGTIAIETINPSTMELLDSNYIITKDDRLLRINKKDTIAFKRRY
jgi:hypothetical protein